MNPTGFSSNSMLNRKRRPSDEENFKYEKEKNYKDHSSHYYHNEQRSEDLEFMTGSENNKKSDFYKPRDHPKEKERERNREYRDRVYIKENLDRREKYNKNERRNSFSRKNEENFDYGYAEIHNRNKNYQIRKQKQNKKRKYNDLKDTARHSHNYHYNEDFLDERDRGNSNVKFEIQRNERKDKHIKREDIRLSKSEIQHPYKRRHNEELESYGHSFSYERDREDEHKFKQDERVEKEERLENQNKFNFLIILPKNYFRIIEEDYGYIIGELKKRIRDLNLFQYEYKISNFNEFILRIDASRLSSKVTSLKFVCGVLFEAMKQTYQNMSYLKISILVPSRFIIGIEGKNINNIRDMTETRIDIFQNDINNKYRQIEIQGSPENISRATEKIYKIVDKYYFYDNSNRRRLDENSSRDDEYKLNKYAEQEEENKRNKLKRARRRLGNRNDRKKNRSEERKDSDRDRLREIKPRKNGDNDFNERKENKHSRRNSKNSPTSKSDSISKFQLVDKNISKEISPINADVITYPNTDFTQQISEKFPPNLNMLNVIQSNLMENSNQLNIQLSRESKTSIVSIESDNNRNISNISETIFTGEIQKIESKLTLPEKLSEDLKIPLNIIITNQNLNMLKNEKSNIFIEIENKYHCSISKKVEKLSEREVNILTFYGTPEQNCLAVYYLQQIISGRKESKEITKN